MRSDIDDRPVFGECEICGHEMHEETDGYDGDDFVEINGIIVCSDCWYDYFRALKAEQKR